MPLCYKARPPITPWSLCVPPVSCGGRWQQFPAAFTHSTLPSKYIQNPVSRNSGSGSRLSATSASHAFPDKTITPASTIPFSSSASLPPNQTAAQPPLSTHTPSLPRDQEHYPLLPGSLVSSTNQRVPACPRHQPCIVVTATVSLSKSVSIHGSREGASLTDMGSKYGELSYLPRRLSVEPWPGNTQAAAHGGLEEVRGPGVLESK